MLPKLIPFLIAGFFLLAPTAFAADTFFGPIIPTQCQTCPCGYAAVLETIRHLINIGITICILAVVITLAYGGALLLTSATNGEAKNKAKGVIANAIIGLVIVLAGWLIVDFVMKSLYTDDNGGAFGPWNSILAGDENDWCVVATKTNPLFSHIIFTPPTQNPDIPNTPNTPGGSSPIVGNEATVRKAFSDAGIAINKQPCPEGKTYQSVPNGCTTVGGLRQATVDQVIKLKSICGSVQVTGGNELGHADGGQSHTTGYKVDLGTGLDACVSSQGSYFSRNGSRGSDPRYLDKCGNEYVRENSHWDITVSQVCSK